jgi:hypothetical protein
MKKQVITLIALGATLGLSNQAQAAGDTATATATAQIINPIAIKNNNGLDFGSIISGSNESIVTVNTKDDRTLASGDAVLVQNATTPKAASFTITGGKGAMYSIVIPESIAIYSPSDKMEVNKFVSSSTGTIPEGGEETFKVGANLVVQAKQPAGEYSGEFDVTVSYN